MTRKKNIPDGPLRGDIRTPREVLVFDSSQDLSLSETLAAVNHLLEIASEKIQTLPILEDEEHLLPEFGEVDQELAAVGKTKALVRGVLLRTQNRILQYLAQLLGHLFSLQSYNGRFRLRYEVIFPLAKEDVGTKIDITTLRAIVETTLNALRPQFAAFLANHEIEVVGQYVEQHQAIEFWLNLKDKNRTSWWRQL